MKILFLVVLFLPLAAGAQVQKCQIDGKTVYSDSLCGQSGTSVDTSSNTIDHSGLRQQAAKIKATEMAVAANQKRAEAKQRKIDERTERDRAFKQSNDRFHKKQLEHAEAQVRGLRALLPP